MATGDVETCVSEIYILGDCDTKDAEFLVVYLWGGFLTSKGAILSRDQTARQWLRE